MESYKHSCPFCGQHIEYTVGYCGKQMQCPMCGQTVTFPAIPPSRTGSTLRVRGAKAKPASRKWFENTPKALGFLRDFQHWNVVAQCAVPFLLIGALLAGAIFVKNKLGESSAPVPIAPVQADPEAWQHMTDLTKADEAVRKEMKAIDAAHVSVTLAEQRRREAENQAPFVKKNAEAELQAAHKMLDVARSRFDKAVNKYYELGGTVDYRSQLKNY
jgi:hypothetical protein